MITVNGNINTKVSVTQLDCIVQMLLNLCDVKYESDLGRVCTKDGGLYLVEDISYHGSAVWEDTLISSNAEGIKAFDSLMLLKTYYEGKQNGVEGASKA